MTSADVFFMLALDIVFILTRMFAKTTAFITESDMHINQSNVDVSLHAPYATAELSPLELLNVMSLCVTQREITHVSLKKMKNYIL